MKANLIQLFHYSHWANRLILDQMLEHQVEDEKMIFWINHIVNAEQVWMDRIELGTTSASPITMRSLEACSQALNAEHGRIIRFLNALEEVGLSERIAYHNTKGTAYENTLQDILYHLVNHCTHHRSQIAARLREQGIAPAPTDYIFYLRAS